MAPFKISILLLIKSWTFWYIERLPTSSYTAVTYFQKWSVFFGPTCISVQLGRELNTFAVVLFCWRNQGQFLWEGLGDDNGNEEDMFTSYVCSVCSWFCDTACVSCIIFIYLFTHLLICVVLIPFQFRLSTHFVLFLEFI